MWGTPTHDIKISLPELGEHHGLFKRAESNSKRNMPRSPLFDIYNQVSSAIRKLWVLRGDGLVIEGDFFKETGIAEPSFTGFHSDQVKGFPGRQSQLTNDGYGFGFFIPANLNRINREFVVFGNFKP